MRGLDAEKEDQKTVAVKQSDIALHFAAVGEWLSNERRANNRRFIDIELNMNGQKDYLHSAVAFAHSSYLRNLMTRRRPPFSLNLDNFRPRTVFKVVDWMYHGHTDFSVEHIGNYLEVTAFLGVDDLHRHLEQTFRALAQKETFRIYCMNLASNPRYQISANSRRNLVSDIARFHDALSTEDIKSLTPESCCILVSEQTVSFNEKLDLINLIIFWLRSDEKHRYAGKILSSIRIANISERDNARLIEHLIQRMSVPNCPNFYVYGKGRDTVMVSTNPQRFTKNCVAVVTPAEEKFSSTNVDLDENEKQRNRIEASMIQEINKLPDFSVKKSRSNVRSSESGTRFGKNPTEHRFFPQSMGSDQPFDDFNRSGRASRSQTRARQDRSSTQRGSDDRSNSSAAFGGRRSESIDSANERLGLQFGVDREGRFVGAKDRGRDQYSTRDALFGTRDEGYGGRNGYGARGQGYGAKDQGYGGRDGYGIRGPDSGPRDLSPSQKLINGRMFSESEVEEHNQLPPSSEVFKEASYRPQRRFSKASVVESSASDTLDGFRRPRSAGSVPSSLWQVKPSSRDHSFREADSRDISPSQRLINGRMFSESEVEEHNQLPPSSEVFKEAGYGRGVFRRPSNSGSISSSAWQVNPSASDRSFRAPSSGHRDGSPSQKLINARMFSESEVEEHNQLPPSTEVFKEANYRPSKRFSKASVADSPASGGTLGPFRRPSNPGSISSSAWQVKPNSENSTTYFTTNRSDSRDSEASTLSSRIMKKRLMEGGTSSTNVATARDASTSSSKSTDGARSQYCAPSSANSNRSTYVYDTRKGKR
ncbi:unnamed protein product [Bursaphelenchus okinawaensis]|uniref:BTB domain-containing protein n=1 Tax=Bursaphelenchus okinawaensis TaxID=465554 RepID=A0A811LML5_9BILA|nr:unnamed protein product [Bursaphelenchus okinawaensis]CAG9124187.1 unnamed protein product [Bursaphelenchus okinawaensis]